MDQSAGLDVGLGHGFYGMRTNAPLGQTFTPAASTVGFVELGIGQGGPSKLRVSLRSDAITGSLLARSSAVNVARDFQGVVLFSFATNIAVVPGRTYCLEAEVEAGSDCTVAIYHFGYPRGAAILKGNPASPAADMWFREGPITSFPRFGDASFDSDGGRVFKTSLVGHAGQFVVVEFSTNLIEWNLLRTNVLSVDPLPLVIPGMTAPQTYYRASYVKP